MHFYTLYYPLPPCLLFYNVRFSSKYALHPAFPEELLFCACSCTSSTRLSASSRFAFSVDKAAANRAL